MRLARKPPHRVGRGEWRVKRHDAGTKQTKRRSGDDDGSMTLRGFRRGDGCSEDSRSHGGVKGIGDQDMTLRGVPAK
jgi:hypothetical protein